MPTKQLIMEGCQSDTEELLALLSEGLKLRPTWSESTFENRILQDYDFRSRLASGRVSPRKMMASYRKMKAFIKDNEKPA